MQRVGVRGIRGCLPYICTSVKLSRCGSEVHFHLYLISQCFAAQVIVEFQTLRFVFMLFRCSLIVRTLLSKSEM